jgi:hypothetical protein
MKKILVILSLVLTAVIAASCGKAAGEKYGQQISNYKVTAIKEILSTPKAYDGKLVTIEGRIGSECSSGCWFFVKVDSGNFSLYVDIRPAGFAIPQNVGRKVIVEGTVFIDKTGPKVKGRGVEIK